jgi:hypothetical protein
MRVYLAGTPGTEEREKGWQRLCHSRLLSFWDITCVQFSVREAFLLIKKSKKA